jgi:hypothetical protein
MWVKKSVIFQPTPQTTLVNAWTGDIMTSHPTFSTPTGMPKGHKNEFFHGGVKDNNSNTVSFHGYGNKF